MLCSNCRKELVRDAKFCKHCGEKISAFSQAEMGSVDLYFDKKENTCQLCGSYAPIKYVEFHQNIGMLVRREHKQIKGKLCKNCIGKTFLSFTLMTVAVGWLGTISLFLAPVFVLNNVYYYVASLGLKNSK